MSEQNNTLIELLEKEMHRYLLNIDIPVQQESTLDIKEVCKWYIEAEKLIRVLANILNAPMNQAINQLRYAGHHVLKAQCSDDGKQQNLIESYKHCKRAVYDALDFYVYKLNEYYRVLLPLLNSQDAIKVERLLKDHIREINQCRTGNETRIEYYTGIQNKLVDGLRLIEQLNEIQRETGITEKLFQEKSQLCSEISVLNKHVKLLQDEIASREAKDESRSYKLALIITLILAAGTFFGLVSDTFLPSYHEVTYSQKQQEVLSSSPITKE